MLSESDFMFSRRCAAPAARLFLMLALLVASASRRALAQEEGATPAARDRYLREMNMKLAVSAGYLPVAPADNSISGRLYAEAVQSHESNETVPLDASHPGDAEISAAVAAPESSEKASGPQIVTPDPTSPAQYADDIRNFYRAADPDRWLMMISVPGWLPGMQGDMTIKGISSKVNLGLDDMLNILEDYFDYGAMLNVEARRGKWSIFGDLLYLKMSGDFEGEATLPPLVVGGPDILPRPGITIGASGNFEFNQTIAELGGGYRFLDVPWGGEGSRKRVSMDLIGGLRYWRLESQVDLDLSATVGPRSRSRSFSAEGTQAWIDPFIGARAQADLTEKLFVWLRGDIGGFGLGSGLTSEFTWKAAAGASYNLTRRLSVFAGWQILDVDYENGDFEFDMRMGGPVAGFGYTLGGPSQSEAQKE